MRRKQEKGLGKNLGNLKDPQDALKISRIGVYGVAMNKNQVLLITQKNGPYAGKFDLPGGGIEFGETIEQTLRREFQEEINMAFDTMLLLNNLTATVLFQDERGSLCEFHQIGLIYSVAGIHLCNETTPGSLNYSWIDISNLNKDNASPFVLAQLCLKN